MIKGRYGYNQQREDGSVWYQIFLSDNLLSADEIVQRLSDAEMTSNLFSDRELERLKTENLKLREENKKLKEKIETIGDMMIDFEQRYYTEVCEPSEEYDETVLCELSNLFFGGKE